jgi:hypothetical protein
LQRAGNTGEMALAANRENMWVNINTRLVKEIEQLREVSAINCTRAVDESSKMLVFLYIVSTKGIVTSNPPNGVIPAALASQQ